MKTATSGLVRSSLLAPMLMLALPAAAFAQSGLASAFELERAGRFAEAAETYRYALRAEPANLPALLGLERVSQQTEQPESLLVYVAAALREDSGNRYIRSVELRAWAAAANMDSLAAAAARWIEVESESPDPYREWAFAVSQRGDLMEAQRILTLGRDRLGAEVLARELAQIWVVTGEWTRAAEYWAAATRRDQSLASTAAVSLSRTNPANRAAVINILIGGAEKDPAKLVAADLLAGWNRPLEGWVLLDHALPDDPTVALGILRGFVDRVRRLRGGESDRTRGYALERIAGLTSGSFAEDARLEAARAFADAGEREAAERLLSQITVDSTVVSPSQAGAMAALIGVMAESGRVAQAEERFVQWSERLLLSDVSQLRITIARAWVMKDSLDRAERVVSADSSLEVMAVRGWIALFRGDLKGAVNMYRAAGPLAGNRADATLRTEMMALLQLIAPDTLPELGRAMLTLHRGDTVSAVRELETAASRLPTTGGRAEVLSLAGRLAFETGDYAGSERLLDIAVRVAPDSPTAPLSHFLLARNYLATGRREECITKLESVIIEHSGSAVAPRARRLLSQVQGMIPQS